MDGRTQPPVRLGAHCGMTTESITWMTPLLAEMSVLTTRASPTVTLQPFDAMLSGWPFTVGAIIVFTLSVSAYVTPSILSGGRQNVTSMLIFQQYAAVLDFQFGAALSVVLLVTTLILVGTSIMAVDRGQRAA